MPLDNLLYYPVGGNAYTEAARTGDASLDLDLTSKLDPRITFTRASVATVTTDIGQVLPVKSGEARFEGCRRIENTLSRTAGAKSNDLTSNGWYDGNGCVRGVNTITIVNSASYAAFGYDTKNTKGQFILSFDAWSSTPCKFQPGMADVADGSDFLHWDLNITTVRTRYYCYADYSGSSTFTGNLGINFNLYGGWAPPNGTVIYLTDVQIEDVSGTGQTTPSEYVSVGVLSYPYHGAGVDGVKYVTSPQAPISAKGLLMEEARQNQQLQSQSMGSAPWYVGAATIPSYGLAPDGTYTAAFLREASDVAQIHYLSFGAATYSPSATYTRSIYAKAGTRTWFALQAVNLANVWMSAYFNLTAGTVPTIGGVGCSATIVPVGNGWFRCSMTYPSGTGATPSNDAVLIGDATGNPSYNGDGTSGLYLWGAQLELGVAATSYVPTTAATDTRAIDRAEITSLPAMTPGVYSRTSWWNASAGTLYAEGRNYFPISDAGVRMYATITDHYNLTNCLRLETLGDLNRVVYTVASNATVPASPTRTVGATHRLVATYDSSGCRSYVDAAGPYTAVAGLMGSIVRLSIGSNEVYHQFNGNIRRVTYWPHVVNDAQLKRITS